MGWGGGIHFCPWPMGTSALPSVAPDSPHLLSGFHFSALFLPLMASYQ